MKEGKKVQLFLLCFIHLSVFCIAIRKESKKYLLTILPNYHQKERKTEQKNNHREATLLA